MKKSSFLFSANPIELEECFDKKTSKFNSGLNSIFELFQKSLCTFRKFRDEQTRTTLAPGWTSLAPTAISQVPF